MNKKILLMIFFVLNCQTKLHKKTKKKHDAYDDKLITMNPKKAVEFLSNHKKLSGKPLKIKFSTVTALATKGYKNQMRKLFERKAFLISVPYTTQRPKFSKFFLQSVVGVLGLKYGAKKYHEAKLKEQIEHMTILNQNTVQENMVMKLTRQNQLQQIDDLIDGLSTSFESISQRLMKQSYDLKSTIDFSLNHAQRKLKQVEHESVDQENNQEHDQAQEQTVTDKKSN